MFIRQALISLALLGSFSAPSFAGEDFIVDGLTRRDPSQSIYTQQQGKVGQDRRASEQMESNHGAMMGNRSSAATASTTSTANSQASTQASPVHGANFHSGAAPTYNDLYRGGN